MLTLLWKDQSTKNKITAAETGLQSRLKRELADFFNYEERYHQLVFDIIQQQKLSTSLVLR